jgi:ribosomal protein L18E
MKHNQLDDVKKNMILDLKKKARESKQDFYLALSRALDTSSRRAISVNIYTLEKFAKKNPSKTFLIAGSLLGFGELESKVNVYAFKASKNALEKIKAKKGTIKDFSELLKAKIESKDVMILK